MKGRPFLLPLKPKSALGRKKVKKGSLRWDVYCAVFYEVKFRGRAVTSMEVLQGLGYGRRLHYHRQIVVYAYLSSLAREGHIRKVSPGLYTTRDDNRSYDPASLKERLVLFLDREGPKTVAQLATIFDRNPKSVRTTLSRLQKDGRVKQIGSQWGIDTNVISLDDRRSERDGISRTDKKYRST